MNKGNVAHRTQETSHTEHRKRRTQNTVNVAHSTQETSHTGHRKRRTQNKKIHTLNTGNVAHRTQERHTWDGNIKMDLQLVVYGHCRAGFGSR
jgi:uncharacterized protein YlxW (UPF0749 family)